MTGVQELHKCPQCNIYDPANSRGLFLEYQTRDGSIFAGCTECNYGFREIVRSRCSRCDLDFNTLLKNLDDADWMINFGNSVKACPACGCTLIIREYAKYNASVQWIKVPLSALRPMDELTINNHTVISKKEKFEKSKQITLQGFL